MPSSVEKDPFSPAERLIKDRPLPAYSYVPGMHPHPIREEDGHSFGVEISVPKFDADEWRDCLEFLFGIDLFNAGFYWEAHESWEAVWIAAGRKGVVADFLKGLIKLAAAGVKAREGNENGVRRHAARAEQLFVEAHARRVYSEHEIGLSAPISAESVQNKQPLVAHSRQPEMLGLRVDRLVEFSQRLGRLAKETVNPIVKPVQRVWSDVLIPEDSVS